MCPCAACLRFRTNNYWFMTRKGLCGVCGREDLNLMDSVPGIVLEFLQSETVCWCCCNSINCHVAKELKLCWGSHSDEMLKWGLAKWAVDHYFSNHFYNGFVERDCCKTGLHAKRVA